MAHALEWRRAASCSTPWPHPRMFQLPQHVKTMYRFTMSRSDSARRGELSLGCSADHCELLSSESAISGRTVSRYLRCRPDNAVTNLAYIPREPPRRHAWDRLQIPHETCRILSWTATCVRSRLNPMAD